MSNGSDWLPPGARPSDDAREGITKESLRASKRHLSLAPESTSIGIFLFPVVVFLALSWWLAYSEKESIMASPTIEWTATRQTFHAQVFIEKFVKTTLKNPLDAQFPDYQPEYVGDGKYRFSTYVDATNSFGATVRTRFSGEIEQTKDHWIVTRLDFHD